MCIYVHVEVCVYVCICKCFPVWFCGLIQTYTNNHIHTYTCIVAFLHTYIHTYIHTCIHKDTHTHTYSTHTACVSIHAYLQHISADYAMHVLYIFVRYPCESCCLASEPRCNPSATCLRAVTCSSISRPSFSASYLNVACLASCSTLYTVHRTVSYSNARSALL